MQFSNGPKQGLLYKLRFETPVTSDGRFYVYFCQQSWSRFRNYTKTGQPDFFDSTIRHTRGDIRVVAHAGHVYANGVEGIQTVSGLQLD